MAKQKPIKIPLSIEVGADNAQQIGKQIESAFGGVSSVVTQLSNSVKGLGKGLPNLLKKVEEGARRLNDTLQGIDTGKLTGFANSVKNVGSGLSSLSGGLKGVTKSRLDGLIQLGETIDNLSLSFQNAANRGFARNAQMIAYTLQNVANSASEAIKAQRALNQANNAIQKANQRTTQNPATNGTQPQLTPQPPPNTASQFTAPLNRFQNKVDQITQKNRRDSKKGFLGLGFNRLDEILPSRGPIVQVTGLIFLLQGAAFGIIRVFDRLTAATLGANIALEKQVISLQAITGSYEEAKRVIQDFAIPFAANVPFFESDQIIGAVNRLAAEGFGVDQITGRLEAGFNRFTGKFEEQFEGGLVKTLGSTAVAFGRTLDQSVDAFVSAIQGRFTKIRRFGVDKQELKAFGFEEGGDVRTNAQAIQSLLDIRFGDLIQQQAETFTGAISNIQDVLANLSRASFEGTFKVVREELIDFVKTLSAYEQAFSTALATQEEFEAKLKTLDPEARRNAINMRNISDALARVTEKGIEAVKFLLQFKEILAAITIAPVIAILGNTLVFTFQKLTESVLKFSGVLDQTGKFQVPRFIQKIGDLGKLLRKPFGGFTLRGTELTKQSADLVRQQQEVTNKITRLVKDRAAILQAQARTGTTSSIPKTLATNKQQIKEYLAELTKLSPSREGGSISKFFGRFSQQVDKVKDSFKDLRTVLRGTSREFYRTSAAFRNASRQIQQESFARKLADEAGRIAKGGKNLNLSEALLNNQKTRGSLTQIPKAIDGIANGFSKVARALRTVSNFKLTGLLKGVSSLTTSLTSATNLTKLFGSSLGGSIAKVLPAISKAAGLFGKVGTLASAALGPIGAIFSAITTGFSAVTSSIGFIVQVIGSVVGVLASTFLGVFKFFLIPTIIETVFALKDLAQGVETVATRSLKTMIESAKQLGQAFSNTIEEILYEIGLLDSVGTDGNRSITVMTKLLDIATVVVNKFREFVPTLGEIFRFVVRLSGEVLQFGAGLTRLTFGFALALESTVGAALFGILKAFQLIGAAIDVLTLGSTTFGETIGGYADTLVDTFTDVNNTLLKTADFLEDINLKVQKFARGKNPTEARKNVADVVFSQATGPSPKKFNELITSGTSNEFVSALSDGLLDKTGLASELSRSVQDSLDNELPTRLKRKISFKRAFSKNKIRNQLKKDFEELYSNTAQVFEKVGRDGSVKLLSFRQLFDQDPSAAIKVVTDRTVKTLDTEINRIVKVGDRYEQALIPDYVAFKLSLQQLSKDSEILSDVIGKPFANVIETTKGAVESLKSYENGIKSLADAEKDRNDQINALGADVFDLQVTGANPDAIEAAVAKRDKAVAESFVERSRDLNIATELKRIATQQNREQAAALKDLQDSQIRFVGNSVEDLKQRIQRRFRGASIGDDIVQGILKAENPADALGPLRKALIDATKGTVDEAQVNFFLRDLLEDVRPLAQTYQDYEQSILKQSEAQKLANKVAQDATKRQQELREQLEATLNTQQKLVENNLELGKISARQAFEQITAIARVRKETIGLEADVESAIATQKKQIDLGKRLLSEFAQASSDTFNRDDAATTLRKSVNQFEATQQVLGQLTEEQRRNADVVSLQNKAYEDAIKGVNAYAKSVLDARKAIRDYRKEQALQRIQAQESTDNLGIAQRLDGNTTSVLGVSPEAESNFRQIEADAAKRRREERATAVEVSALQQEANDNLEILNQLQEDANKKSIEGYNAAAIREAAQKSLNALVAVENRLLKDRSDREKASEDALNSKRENQRKIVQLLKEEVKGAEEIANSRKEAANSILDFRKDLFLTLSGQQELTGEQNADFIRSQINNVQQALSQATSFESAKQNAKELLELYKAARDSGQFDVFELRGVRNEILKANRQLDILNPVREKQQESALRQQNIESLRALNASLNKVYTENSKAITDNTTALQGVAEAIKNFNLEERAFDQSAIAGNLNSITRDQRERFNLSGGVVSDNAALSGESNRIKAALSQRNFTASFTQALADGAQKIQTNAESTAVAFKSLQTTTANTAINVIKAARATEEVAKRVQAVSDRLNTEAVKSLVVDIGSKDDLTRTYEDLQRLQQVQNPAVTEQPKTATEVQNGGSLQSSPEVSELLTRLAEVMEKEKDVTINLGLDSTGADDFGRAVVRYIERNINLRQVNDKDIR